MNYGMINQTKKDTKILMHDEQDYIIDKIFKFLDKT